MSGVIPWLVRNAHLLAGWGGLAALVIAVLVVLLRLRRRRIARAVQAAGRLVEEGDLDQALAVCGEMFARRRSLTPAQMTRLKVAEGNCYFRRAYIEDFEGNLLRAVESYGQAVGAASNNAAGDERAEALTLQRYIS